MLYIRLTFLLSLMIISSLPGCSTASRIEHRGCYVTDQAIRGYYQGQCNVQGQAHGQGKSVGKDTYEGQFVNGTITGYGTYTWADGARYTGQLKNAQANGQGTFIDSNGETFSGNWRNNELIQ